MKRFNKIQFLALLVPVLFWSCQEDDYELGEIMAPSNVQVTVDIVGANADNPNGDGSGVVNFRATADNALSYQYVFNDVVSSSEDGSKTYEFSNLGLNTYTVTLVAYGTAGASTSQTVTVDVLSLYEPPAELVTILTADDSRTWRIKAEAARHFGLGPVGGDPFEFYGANPNDKATSGMYDDRYIFNVDGTFTHVTNGTVFGRNGLIQELGGAGGGESVGDDIENYVYDDYQAQWSLSAPGGNETITLTGIGFIGYYVGGDHKYQIISRSANELVIKTTDGNGQFDWGFTLVPE